MENYCLVLDVSGNAEIKKIDKNAPFFILASILIKETDYLDVFRPLAEKKIFNKKIPKNPILYYKNIVELENSDSKKIAFYNELKNLIYNLDFEIIATSILKEKYYLTVKKENLYRSSF